MNDTLAIVLLVGGIGAVAAAHYLMSTLPGWKWELGATPFIAGAYLGMSQADQTAG